MEDVAITAQPRHPSTAEDQLAPGNDNTEGTSGEKGTAVPSESGTTTPEYPKAWKLFVIVAALCLAVFLVALDQTIVAVAVPKITDHFHSLDDVGWYVFLMSADLATRQDVVAVLGYHALSWASS